MTDSLLFDADLVRRALIEDIGRGDVTTEATIPTDAQAAATIVTREPGVIAGLPITRLAFLILDPDLCFEALVEDGASVAAGAHLARVSGNARAILTAERTALNFLGRLSGIATQTARCVEAVRGTSATIVDTR